MVDGIDPQKLRETLEADIMAFEDHTKHSVEFYESAGGFAPTIGIIGAVLGLIHVMGNLSDTSKLGGGIAVAVYRWLGLKFLTKSWFDLDIVWALSLVLVGTIGFFHAL